MEQQLDTGLTSASTLHQQAQHEEAVLTASAASSARPGPLQPPVCPPYETSVNQCPVRARSSRFSSTRGQICTAASIGFMR